MRRTDSLSPTMPDYWGTASKDAITQFCEAVGGVAPADFVLLSDRQDMSAVQGNRSGCTYAAIRFDNPVDAATFWALAQAKFPNVGMELHSSPNGLVDKGNGVLPRTRTVFSEYSSRYIPDTGPSYTVLVDVQNLRRHFDGDDRGAGVPLDLVQLAESVRQARTPTPCAPVEVLSSPSPTGWTERRSR